MKCEKWRNEVGDVVIFVDDEYVLLDCVDRGEIEATSIYREKIEGKQFNMDELKEKYRRNGFKPFTVDRKNFHFFSKRLSPELKVDVAVNTEADAEILIGDGYREYSASTVNDAFYLQYYDKKENRQVLVSANSWSLGQIMNVLGLKAQLNWRSVGSQYLRVGECILEACSDYYCLNTLAGLLDAELISKSDFEMLAQGQQGFEIICKDNYNRDAIEDRTIFPQVWGTESQVRDLVEILQEADQDDEDYLVYKPLTEELHSFE